MIMVSIHSDKNPESLFIRVIHISLPNLMNFLAAYASAVHELHNESQTQH